MSHHCNTESVKLFATKANNFRYSDFTTIDQIGVSDATEFFLPCVVDTEFYHHQSAYNKPELSAEVQRTLTCQVRHAWHDDRVIFSHPESSDIARHPLMMSEFLVVDYLTHLGYDCKLHSYDSGIRYGKDERTLQIDIYAHFAISELFRIFQGKMRETILKLSLGRVSRNTITQGRRVVASNNLRTGVSQQWVSLDKFLIEINGVKFRLRLGVYDTIALLGNNKLETLATLAGHELQYKTTISNEEKERMNQVYVEDPDKFDQYSLGDLDVYDILLKIEDRNKKVYEDIDLKDYWEGGTNLRMTIGATVAKMLEASLMKHMGISDLKLLRTLTKPGTCEVIKQGGTTGVYLAKVDGGRCRNNRPTELNTKNLICDIDIDGCYGNGLRNQIYPIGKPVIIDLPIDAKENKFQSLGKFIETYGSDLVPGLWQARVSVKPGYKLKYGQDFLISWYPPKQLDKLPTDTDLESVDWWTVDNVGLTKIYTHDVHLAIVTHDVMQMIDKVCSVRQRRELLDNLVVVSALYYPKSNRVKTPDDLFTAIKNHTGKNTCEIKGRKKKTKETKLQECHAWYGVNLGELIVNKLMSERGKYRKSEPDEKPFNDLYKLYINTIYGDQVSPFFEIGNVCVGNNITARARCMAWYMEKGLHGFQTITDGCAFELNRVVFPEKTRITTETIFEAYTKGTHDGNYNFKPLDGEEIKVVEWKKQKEDYKCLLIQNEKPLSYNEIGELTIKHLQTLFPDVDVLNKETKDLDGKKQKGQFTLSVKNIFNGGSFHGSANYIFHQAEDYYIKAKMRSYGKDAHKAVELIEGRIEISNEEYHPASEFLKNLYTNPQEVSRGLAFIDKSILKIGSFKQLYDARWENSKAFPGCTIERVRLLREFSPNQFTYRNHEQFLSWQREHSRLLKQTGQSYEQFFLNKGEKETVDCTNMAKSIDKAIRTGSKSFLSAKVVKDLKTGKKSVQNHPAWNCVQKMLEIYGIIYGFMISLEEGDPVSDEWVDES